MEDIAQMRGEIGAPITFTDIFLDASSYDQHVCLPWQPKKITRKVGAVSEVLLKKLPPKQKQKLKRLKAMGEISTLLEVNSDQNPSAHNLCLQTINSPKSPSSLQRSVSFTGPKFSLNQNSRENQKKHGNKSKTHLPNVSSDRGISINISNNSVDP